MSLAPALKKKKKEKKGKKGKKKPSNLRETSKSSVFMFSLNRLWLIKSDYFEAL